MISKKYFITLQISALYVLVLVAQFLPENYFAFASKTNEDSYSIVCNSQQNKFTDSTTSFKTKLGNNAIFTINGNYENKPDIWLSMNQGASFTNETRIRGLETIKIEVTGNGEFTLLFAKTKPFDIWQKTYQFETDTSFLIEMGGKPSFMQLVCKSENLTIKKMTLSFSCESEETITDWDIAHGVIPSIQDNTLTYGLYPQTHVNDTNLISELTAKANELNIKDEEYFWYDNEYYVKDTGNPKSYDYMYKFQDKTRIVPNETYFFKCEPIKWVIHENKEGTLIVDSLCPLDVHTFDLISNAYKNSEVRTYINNTFYNRAFFMNTTPIQLTSLSDVDVVDDKVWLGSKSQYENEWSEYVAKTSRIKKPTDFALCNHSYLYSTNRSGTYWTRTASTLSDTAIFVVNYKGSVLDNGCTVSNDSWDIVPALTIKI